MPVQIFITNTLPKGPTCKVQRRFMADHFIKKAGGLEKNSTAAASGVQRGVATAPV